MDGRTKSPWDVPDGTGRQSSFVGKVDRFDSAMTLNGPQGRAARDAVLRVQRLQLV
ncbi:MAG: hypothetical protein ACREA9_23280 [Pyrinomonadaceae bacterium]